jgi:hypothetical protein
MSSVPARLRVLDEDMRAVHYWPGSGRKAHGAV